MVNSQRSAPTAYGIVALAVLGVIALGIGIGQLGSEIWIPAQRGGVSIDIFCGTVMNPRDFPFGTYPNCQAALAHHQALGITALVFGAIFTGAAIIVYRVTRPLAEKGMKKCPDCAETVLADAKVCKYCGHRFASGGLRGPAEDIVEAFEPYYEDHHAGRCD